MFFEERVRIICLEINRTFDKTNSFSKKWTCLLLPEMLPK